MTRVLVPQGDLFVIATGPAPGSARSLLEQIEAHARSWPADDLEPALRAVLQECPGLPRTGMLAALLAGSQLWLEWAGPRSGSAWLIRAGKLCALEPGHEATPFASARALLEPGDRVVLASEGLGLEWKQVEGVVGPAVDAQGAADALLGAARDQDPGADVAVQVIEIEPASRSAAPPVRRAPEPPQARPATLLAALGSWQVLSALALGAVVLGVRLAAPPADQASPDSSPSPAIEAQPSAGAPVAEVPLALPPVAVPAAAPSPRQSDVAPRPAPTHARTAAIPTAPRPAPSVVPSPERFKVYVLILKFGDPAQAGSVGAAVRRVLAPREVECVPVFANQVEALHERTVYFRGDARAEAARLGQTFEYQVEELPRDFRERFAEAALVVVPGGAS
jgi:hypothetical protein